MPRSRVLATLAYTLLPVAPIALVHTIVFLLPWSPLRLPGLADSLRWNVAMLVSIWLLAVLLIAVGSAVLVRQQSPRSKGVLFRALSCRGHGPPAVLWVTARSLTLRRGDEDRVIVLGDIQDVRLETGWANLVGVFFWRERYPLTLTLRGGEKVPIFAFAARALAETIERARAIAR